MEMPTFDEFNDAVEKIRNSFKYLRFNQRIIERIEEVLKSIGKALDKLLSRSLSLPEHDASGHLLQGIFVVIAVIILAVLTLIIIKTIRRRMKKKVTDILGEKIDKNTTVNSLMERSAEFESLGEYREAIRFRYIAVLFHLHQTNILYHDATMTGGEMVTELRKSQYAAAESFNKLTLQFNSSWYGVKEVQIEEFQRWQTSESVFWKEAGL